MEIFNIVTLNEHDYVILNLVTYDNKDYALLEEIDKEENPLNNRLIGRLVIKDGEDGIELVTNKESLEYKNVSRLFFEILTKE